MPASNSSVSMTVVKKLMKSKVSLAFIGNSELPRATITGIKQDGTLDLDLGFSIPNDIRVTGGNKAKGVTYYGIPAEYYLDAVKAEAKAKSMTEAKVRVKQAPAPIAPPKRKAEPLPLSTPDSFVEITKVCFRDNGKLYIANTTKDVLTKELAAYNASPMNINLTFNQWLSVRDFDVACETVTA